MIKVGTIVFATGDCKDGAQEARAWLKKKQLTPKQVRFYRHDDMILVQALVPLHIPLRHDAQTPPVAS